MNGTIATVMGFCGNFAPRNWAYCNGALQSVSANTALFSLIGCTWGGDCRTTFALPDYRGRAILGAGAGPGLSDRPLGAIGGAETTTLTVSNLPSHNHTLYGSTNQASAADPAGAYMARTATQGIGIYNNTDHSVSMGASSVGNNGGNLPFNNMMPWGTTNWVICLYGIYPSRG